MDVSKVNEAGRAAANAFVQPTESIGDAYGRVVDEIGDRLSGLSTSDVDEFFSQVTEYSGIAEEAGLSSQRFFNLVFQGINRGVQTDKLIDSIKEFNIEIVQLSKGQRETLEKTLGGEFLSQLEKGISEGTLSSAQALDLVATEIGKLGPKSVEARKLVSEIFKGAGEDTTARAIQLYLGVTDSLDSVIDTTNVYYQRKQELVELEKEAAKGQTELAAALDGTGHFADRVGLQIKTGFFRILTSLINSIKFFPEIAAIAWAKAQADIQSFVNVGKQAINALATPINLLLEAIGSENRLELEITPPDYQAVIEAQKNFNDAVQADRDKFAEQQRQKALEAQGKEEAAKRLQALQEEEKRQKEIARLTLEEKKKLAEQELKLEKAKQDLLLELMEDGAAKRVAKLQSAAQREIDGLKGSAEKRAEVERLIRERLLRDIEKVEKEELVKSVKRVQEVAEAEVKAIERTGVSREEAESEIQRRIAVRTDSLISESYSRRVQVIEQQSQAILSSIKGEGEKEIAARAGIETKKREQIAQLRQETLALGNEQITQQTNERISNIETESQRQIAAIKQVENGKLRTEEEILEERKVIEQQKQTSITQIQAQAIERRIELLKEAAEAELIAAGGGEQARAEIEQRLQAAIDKVRKDAATAEVASTKQTELQKTREAEKGFNERKKQLDAWLAQRRAAATLEAADAIAAGKQVADAEADLNEEKLADEREYLEALKELQAEFGMDPTDTENNIAQKQLDQAKKQREEDEEQERQKWANIVNIAETAAQAIMAIQNLIAANAERKYKAETDALEKEKAEALELAGDDERQRIKVEESFAKKKEKLDLEYKKKQRQAAIIQAGIDLASNAIKALGTPPVPNFLAAAQATGFGLLQIAAMKANSYRKGGVAVGKLGGVPEGPSHEGGGIGLVNNRTGEVLGEMEGGEPVIILSKKTYANNQRLVDELLYNSMYRGGAAVGRRAMGETLPATGGASSRDYFREGGALNAPTTTPAPEVVEDIQPQPVNNSRLEQKLDELIVAYREGKYVAVPYETALWMKEKIEEMEQDQAERIG